MVKHFIIMSSAYTDGTRIALDITDEQMLNGEAIKNVIQMIRTKCGNDVPLSTHLIETYSISWESVEQYDPFFIDVECTASIHEFIDKINSGRVLSGIDIAKYILSKLGKCTHLALEKLVYFAYADYLCEHGERLFEDTIYAFKHGPIVESVYETYKRAGKQYIEYDEEWEIYTGIKMMPAKSRILFAENGAEKLFSIDRTLTKYGQYSASALVSFTHRPGSPWSRVENWEFYQTIPDNLILAYHGVESI